MPETALDHLFFTKEQLNKIRNPVNHDDHLTSAIIMKRSMEQYKEQEEKRRKDEMLRQLMEEIKTISKVDQLYQPAKYAKIADQYDRYGLDRIKL